MKQLKRYTAKSLLKTNRILMTIFTVLTIVMLTFASCNKDEECQCYQSHEELTTVNNGGVVTTQWVVDYQTQPTSADCSTATGYVSTGTGTRFKTICY